MEKTYYQNPKIEILFGFAGGDPVPTKQDKFKPVEVKQIEESGAEKILNNFYVKNPDGPSIQKFNTYIQELAKDYFEGDKKILRPTEVEVVLSISVTESRYKTIDIDNLAKTVLDALNDIAFEDDSQVVSLICSKHIHPLKINGLLIGITRLTPENGGFNEDIILFSKSKW